MTNEIQQELAKTGGKGNATSFKKGYDPRRWLKGRPKKPKDMKAAEELLQHIIWDELSREIKNESGETIDALRLMIRAMIRNKATQKEILERIAGKVTDRVDVTTGGESLLPKLTDEERLTRMKELALAIAKEINADKFAE